ncbi:hypothetical protein [Vibrio barjaei]|uniref:hypothetical protein n=1 Tax=Vibrio barjaei TaxID=1676683 RepID=UPI00228439D2|nr:hypothetical protein [Vibrio barjaei]MCY9874531.1 hypothetical protein [Vibrio barjaei]
MDIIPSFNKSISRGTYVMNTCLAYGILMFVYAFGATLLERELLPLMSQLHTQWIGIKMGILVSIGLSCTLHLCAATCDRLENIGLDRRWVILMLLPIPWLGMLVWAFCAAAPTNFIPKRDDNRAI